MLRVKLLSIVQTWCLIALHITYIIQRLTVLKPPQAFFFFSPLALNLFWCVVAEAEPAAPRAPPTVQSVDDFVPDEGLDKSFLEDGVPSSAKPSMSNQPQPNAADSDRYSTRSQHTLYHNRTRSEITWPFKPDGPFVKFISPPQENQANYQSLR